MGILKGNVLVVSAIKAIVYIPPPLQKKYPVPMSAGRYWCSVELNQRKKMSIHKGFLVKI